MAMEVGNGGKGGNGRGGYRRAAPMSQINVTPFVDVMLVLLVVFMITAPLLTVGVPVELPRTSASQIGGQDEPLVLTINEQGAVFLQETELPLEAVVPRLNAITGAKSDTRIFVRGDRRIAYGRVMELMGLLNTAGFTRVALVAELPRNEPGPAGTAR
jgi:biopolymer transport protein TolR